MSYDLAKRAKLRCMHLLEKRDYTEKQLREKLRLGSTEYPEDVIEEALSYVKSFHYVDDARYASKYIECMRERKSRRRIEQELYQRGVDRELVSAAFEEAEEINEEEMIRGWMEKKHFHPEEADQKEMQRMYGFLMRKGFSGSAVTHVMRMENME